MNSIIDNQIDLKFILECTPPTEDEIAQARWDLKDYGFWFSTYNKKEKRVDYAIPTEQMVLDTVLANRKRDNKIVSFDCTKPLQMEPIRDWGKWRDNFDKGLLVAPLSIKNKFKIS